MKVRVLLCTVLVVAAGCVDNPVSTVNEPANLLAEPERSGESTYDQERIAVGQPTFTIQAATAVPARVHIITWPYNTTWLTHVPGSNYVDGDGDTWYHLDFWPVKTKYVTVNPFSTEYYEGTPEDVERP